MDAQTTTPARLYIGSAYYPEQWPEANWKEDIRLMAAAGFNVARLGEFAWSTLEPAAGQFNFAWLHQVIDELAAAGIRTVLSTPTAAPPPWLVQQYPAILAVDQDGRRVQVGNRCHYCVNSTEFHAAVQRLVGALGAEFGSNPHVIGWQIDNEYNRYCFCEHCQELFQQFLAQRYETLATLNARWSTTYWSQTYSDWTQIPLPIGPHNPGLMLEHRHFITHSYRRFQRLQIDQLRPHLRPEVWITHNFMYWHEGYDHYDLAADLDLASWDWYVGSGHLDYQVSGAAHDLVRGYKRRSFWLMETQPGHVDWRQINNALNKGETRAAAWHAVAHGAQAVLYWQWRSAYGGQEQYHGTLLDQAGQPRPFYTEAQQIGQDFQAVADALAGAEVRARVALLNCYDSRWSIQAQRHHVDFDYLAHLLHYYRPLAARNVSVDIVSPAAPLDDYSLVIAPALLIQNPAQVAALQTFVANGGHLVLTIRTGMKDSYNALLPQRQPGGLASVAGVEVEEYYALEQPVPLQGAGLTGATSVLWAERLRKLPGCAVQTLASYGPANGWLDGQPAITRHTYGRGQVTYVGVYLEKTADQQALLDEILRTAGVQPDLITPENVEARRLVRPDGMEIYILINHTRRAVSVPLPWPAENLLSDQAVTGELSLEPYGVAVLAPA